MEPAQTFSSVSVISKNTKMLLLSTSTGIKSKNVLFVSKQDNETVG